MSAPMNQWLAGPMPAGVEDVLARIARTEDVRQIAVMPDVHLAGDFCVGTVVATHTRLFPTAVGGDIGCGMLAVRLGGRAELLEDGEKAAKLLGALGYFVPARRHHRRTVPVMPAELRAVEFSSARLGEALRGDAGLEFATLGGGNHFLEVQRDEEENLWLMVHTGSRLLGQLVYHRHLATAKKTETRLHFLDAETAEGAAYLKDVAAARLFAKENRRAIAEAAGRAVELVLGIGARMETVVDCDHNHVQREEHRGTYGVGGTSGVESVLVHRKGATRAGEGEAGIVPGSMGDYSCHTEGRGLAEALCSSSHGAGRVMSRTQARQKITVSALRQRIGHIWYDRSLERGLIEEAPQAYKPLGEVMRAQAELTRTVRVLRPVLVYKGG